MLTNKVIDFSELIEKSTKNFVGRQWVREAVDDFLKSSSSRNFLLLGEPGSGKTSFMSNLVKEKGYPHHFIGKGSVEGIETSTDWHDAARFAESIGYQLISDYGGWIMNWEDWGIKVDIEVKKLKGLLTGARVDEFTATPRLADRPILSVKARVVRLGRLSKVIGVYIKELKMDVEPIVRFFLMTPLKNIAERYPDHQVVIVVDGLDEAKSYSEPERNILKMLPAGNLPQNVRFLLSSRPGEHLETTDFQDYAQKFWLSEDLKGRRDPRTIDDARDFMITLAKDKSIKAMLKKNTISPDHLAIQVAKASQGNFLYLHHYAEGLREGDDNLLNLKDLPIGLLKLYGLYLKAIKSEAQSSIPWIGAYEPVLGVLAVVRESLTLTQIADFSSVDRNKIAQILIRIKQFLDIIGTRVKDRRYSLYHLSFSEFLVSEDNEDLIDALQAHGSISEALLKQQQMDTYKLKNILYHLIEAQRWEDIQNLLGDITYLKSRTAPEQKWAFQGEFQQLIQSKDIPEEKLILLLENVFKAISTQLEEEREKTNWLDTFAYWIIMFSSEESSDRRTLLLDLAKKFDSECGLCSTKLSLQYKEESDFQWAMRFAELATWVYQRSDNYEQCIEACKYAETLCEPAAESSAYKNLLEAEYIRMRARALSRFAAQQKDEKRGKSLESEAIKAYDSLRDTFSMSGQNKWVPGDEEWKILEDYDSNTLLPTRSTSDRGFSSSFKAQVVSNTHDAISAMYIIQFLEGMGGEVRWIHSSAFKDSDFAPHGTRYTVLVGGPKSPGISLVADKFYEQNKEAFLRLYSASEYVSTVIPIKEHSVLCYMIGGPCKANTLHAAWELTETIRQV